MVPPGTGRRQHSYGPRRAEQRPEWERETEPIRHLDREEREREPKSGAAAPPQEDAETHFGGAHGCEAGEQGTVVGTPMAWNGPSP